MMRCQSRRPYRRWKAKDHRFIAKITRAWRAALPSCNFHSRKGERLVRFRKRGSVLPQFYTDNMSRCRGGFLTFSAADCSIHISEAPYLVTYQEPILSPGWVLCAERNDI